VCLFIAHEISPQFLKLSSFLDKKQIPLNFLVEKLSKKVEHTLMAH